MNGQTVTTLEAGINTLIEILAELKRLDDEFCGWERDGSPFEAIVMSLIAQAKLSTAMLHGMRHVIHEKEIQGVAEFFHCPPQMAEDFLKTVNYQVNEFTWSCYEDFLKSIGSDVDE